MHRSTGQTSEHRGDRTYLSHRFGLYTGQRFGACARWPVRRRYVRRPRRLEYQPLAGQIGVDPPEDLRGQWVATRKRPSARFQSFLRTTSVSQRLALMECAADTIMSEYSSGGALAIRSVAVGPPAPGAFPTMTERRAMCEALRVHGVTYRCLRQLRTDHDADASGGIRRSGERFRERDARPQCDRTHAARLSIAPIVCSEQTNCCAGKNRRISIRDRRCNRRTGPLGPQSRRCR